MVEKQKIEAMTTKCQKTNKKISYSSEKKKIIEVIL